MIENYDKIEQRWREFWNKENHDRPIISVYAKNSTDKVISLKRPENNKDAWLDIDYQIKNFRNYIKNTGFLGEAFPVFNPNLGPDFLGSLCGCEIEFGTDTSWSVPCIDDYEDFPPIKFDEKNPWWKKMCEITKAALEDSKGDYLVGITDLHAGADGLVSLRGPENAAFDIYDEPEQFKLRVNEIFPVFKEAALRLNDMISPYQKGCTNWMGILNPDNFWYVASCDFSCMISPENFEEFIIPELLKEIEFLPASFYHLDGPGALRHLDRLLQIEKLGGIQWVYGAGQPSAKHWIPTLQKIQNAGKCVEVACELDDIVPVCENLKPEGVHLICYTDDTETGKAVIKDAERVYLHK